VLAKMREATADGRLLGEGARAGRTHALIQYGLYKLFLSSPEACRSTVQQRMGELKKNDATNPEIAHLDRLEKGLAGLTIATSSRYRLLKEQLREIGWDGSANCPRVLLFTEYRKTQDGLAEALAKDFKIKHSLKYEDQPGQVIATINGSCPDVHMMKTVEAFGTGSAPMRMLVATDVAAEGLNLHHECHNIVHYDLPWSIITLVQRNGRIDRFGQTIPPVLRYLRVNTKQGLLTGDKEIFDRLVAKVEEINRSRRQGESVLKLYDPRLRSGISLRLASSRAILVSWRRPRSQQLTRPPTLRTSSTGQTSRTTKTSSESFLVTHQLCRRPLPSHPQMASPSGCDCTLTSSSC